MKVLLIYRTFSTFVQRDYELLSKIFEVTKLQAKLPKYLFNLNREIKKHDLVFIWFADWYSYLAIKKAKKYKKKTIVILGGFDVARIPEYKLGVFCSPWRSVLVKNVYRNVDRLLSVDESLIEDAIKNSGIDISNKAFTVPTGYDWNKYNPGGKKENLISTVGFVNEQNMWRKGFDVFIETARITPELNFILVGKITKNVKLPPLPKNLELTGYLSEEELIKVYQKSKVFCQLSDFEGLPNTLCESMLCECVPVGTNVYGIPKGIGDTGIITIKKPDEIKKSIYKALKMDGSRARKRIINNFSMKKREMKLKKHIEELMK